jgi:hypothetical protein
MTRRRIYANKEEKNAAIKKARTERYRNDPEYRKKEITRLRLWNIKNRDRVLAKTNTKSLIENYCNCDKKKELRREILGD